VNRVDNINPLGDISAGFAGFFAAPFRQEHVSVAGPSAFGVKDGLAVTAKYEL
jgi:hypothetical protein